MAWDGKTLASDSCSEDGSGHFQGLVKKLFRLKSGGMLGIAGDADARAVIALLDPIKEEHDLPTRAELEATRTDGSYILVLPDKKVFSISLSEETEGGLHFHAGVYPETGKFYAVGHGADYARVAMSLGKTATEAIKEACKWSLATRPPIQSMELGDKPKEKITRVRKPNQSEVVVE